jgi:hypothetical protein
LSQEELRRAERVRVCCRVDVRQPHAVWNAVTDDLSARGCRIVTERLPRLGSHFTMTLSSDLFADELVTIGEVVWIGNDRLGVLFLEEAPRHGSLSPAAWLDRVLEHGRSHAPTAHGSAPSYVVPVVLGAPRETAAIPIRSGRRRSG